MEPNLDAFPLVEDFKVSFGGQNPRGPSVLYSSENHGELTMLEQWRLEKTHAGSPEHEIPLGSREKPYLEAEQGFETGIWEEDGFIYIIMGEEPSCEEYYRWYRVRKEVYLSAWKKELGRYK